MSHNILITGASGYLGGTLLARWSNAKLPAYQCLYTLVRTKEQAESVKQYGAEALTFDIKDEASTTAAIVDHKITIVYFLVDALAEDSQVYMIKALAKVKKQTGQEVHFLHTSGAKLFSSHTGHPTDRPLCDNDLGLYEIQKSCKPLYPIAGKVGNKPSNFGTPSLHALTIIRVLMQITLSSRQPRHMEFGAIFSFRALYMDKVRDLEIQFLSKPWQSRERPKRRGACTVPTPTIRYAHLCIPCCISSAHFIFRNGPSVMSSTTAHCI